MENIFRQQLSTLRQQHKFSQDYLAGKMFVSRQAISKWENGGGEPDIDKIITLATIFGVDIDFLLAGVASKKAPLLSIKNLNKKFDKTVLKNLNLTLSNQERVALLGANGSGKSTLIQLILGLIKADSGTIEHFFNMADDLSVMPQSDNLLENLTTREQIILSASIQGRYQKDLIEQLLTDFNLKQVAKTLVANLSGGQKKRLALLITLIKPVKLLILDEPTVGMDLESIELFWEKLARWHHTVLVVTHDFNQIDKYFDRVLFLQDGQIKSDQQVSLLHSNNQNIEQWYQQTAKKLEVN